MSESAVQQVIGLKVGETYTKSVFIPADQFSPDLLKVTKRELNQNTTPIIARAREKVRKNYSIHGIHGFTSNFEVVVAMVVRCDSSDEL